MTRANISLTLGIQSNEMSNVIIASMSPADIATEREDFELVKRASAGEPGAFDEIFHRYRDQIYSLAYRMTGNAAEAEDLCQEVFMVALKKMDSFEGRSAFSTWLYRVAINRSRDYLRKKKRSLDTVSSSEEGTPEIADSSNSPTTVPEMAAVSADAQRLVQQALMKLPENLRAPLVLHELEGLEYSEVARLLRLPVGTVKSRIFRARTRLGDLLEEHKEQWLG